jgi:hypothetical protein
MAGATDDLSRVYAAVIREARADVAAGRVPNVQALEARIRGAGAPGDEEREALQRLQRVVAVQRARARVSRAAAKTPTRRDAFRARPTISGDFDVRREREGDAYRLAWNGVSAVAEWGVRIAERPDPRSDYVSRGELTLPAATTSVDVPLGEHPLRVHVLGRARGGRVARRAILTSLTRENWGDRWQRR